MGKTKGERYFKADCVTIKKIEDGEIIFYDSKSIYLYQDGYKIGSVFHNWYAPLGSYTNSWKPFRKYLWEYKTLTVRRCYELALKYGVVAMASYRRVDLSGKKVRIINE